MAEISGYDIAFPLFAGVEKSPGLFESNRQILGTALPIGAGYLVTAGHVARALQEPEKIPLLAIPVPGEPGETSVTVVEDIEVLAHDLAILKVPTKEYSNAIEPVIPWFLGEVSAFDELWAIGYPYGLLTRGDGHEFQVRSFRGHAVGNPTRYELPSDANRPTAVYELSFQAPRGLSGGPLLAGLPQRPCIAGIVVGNSSQSMVVHSTTEIDSSGARVTVVERHESLHLGIAIQSTQALPLQSRILDSTLHEHFARRGWLRRSL